MLEEAARMVEDAVNAHLDSLPRYPLEYRGRWRANMCAANRYDGAQSTYVSSAASSAILLHTTDQPASDGMPTK